MTTPKDKHMSTKLFAEVCDYLGGDLESQVCREIKEHLDSCPECRVYIDSVKQTVYLYREHDESLETPANCMDKIMKSIRYAAKKKSGN